MWLTYYIMLVTAYIAFLVNLAIIIIHALFNLKKFQLSPFLVMIFIDGISSVLFGILNLIVFPLYMVAYHRFLNGRLKVDRTFWIINIVLVVGGFIASIILSILGVFIGLPILGIFAIFIEMYFFCVIIEGFEKNNIKVKKAMNKSSNLNKDIYSMQQNTLSYNHYTEEELFKACEQSDLGLVKYLIEKKYINVNIRNNLGETMLFTACKSGNLALVKYLVEERHIDINIRDNRGMKAIFYANNSIVKNYLSKFNYICTWKINS